MHGLPVSTVLVCFDLTPAHRSCSALSSYATSGHERPLCRRTEPATYPFLSPLMTSFRPGALSRLCKSVWSIPRAATSLAPRQRILGELTLPWESIVYHLLSPFNPGVVASPSVPSIPWKPCWHRGCAVPPRSIGYTLRYNGRGE